MQHEMRPIRILGHGAHQIKCYENGLTTYTYPVGDEGETCTFTMLCEVGQPYQRIFRNLLESFNLRVASRVKGFDQAPWMCDTLEPHHD